ncbi:hypothetical protein [Giesbergeria anulus]|uniref:Uncharacterized protein n=1 Tax=Giesbergeria anulus TaxID=180197 RepID=A0A1H9NPF1_9BURK|nr:hypothetical protein [Giesbergeria anulus]SER37243.1 hypothetical protein SAMN02982919_02275 [Giesbergeria anulus]
MSTKAETLIQSIQDFFGNPNQTREETISGLERAKNHIDLLLDTLVEDEDGEGAATPKNGGADTSQ